ncbi:MAG: terpene utilization protein AtuA [Betaproteobacteria bacterium RIFCSPLOWO2_02_FULL_67_19]|nr:MAG: terpene utilization protein AtuA [Betaproteobacteria bacterium RIFCSPLOWO2_02_FULL_67_19]
MNPKVVKIGGASGFWGDSSVGAPQLVDVPGIRYLVFDYLAELTMSILAAARAKNPELGYATDFVDITVRQVLKSCKARGIRLIANAGGVNPAACGRALEKLAAEIGVEARIAVLDGDDVMPLMPALRARGVTDFCSGTQLPQRVASANAYFGAIPIARALALGADIVVTGRVVDSAVTLGALMHEFGWRADDYDRLAAGSLAGHLIECGCQATGGLFTDWRDVPDWADMGYPVIECSADGSFVVTKPENTGGLVSVPSVAEQMLYEIGDPANYVLPDVVCDFTQVRMESAGVQRVRISGARGKPPTDRYKVSATYADGYRCTGTLTITGFEAAAKARRSGEAILERSRAIFRRLGLEDYSGTDLSVLGMEGTYGPHAQPHDLHEAVLRLAVSHPQKQALEIFAREIAPAGTSWSPGTTGSLNAGRPNVAPQIKQFAFLLPKAQAAARLTFAGRTEAVAVPAGTAAALEAGADAVFERPPMTDAVTVPLVRLAWGRSGDKGDHSNIGIIARKAEYLPWIASQVTASAVADYLRHLVKGRVTRYAVPGIGALNFVLENALGGGGMASLRGDPLGKGMAQILLAMPLRIPKDLL